MCMRDDVGSGRGVCGERKKTQVFKKKRTTRDSPRGVASQASDSEVLHKKNKKTIQTERLGSRRCSNRSSEQSSSVVEILFFFFCQDFGTWGWPTHRTTLRGTVRNLPMRDSSAAASVSATSNHEYLSMSATSSSGSRTDTSSVTHSPSLTCRPSTRSMAAVAFLFPLSFFFKSYSYFHVQSMVWVCF